MSATEVNSNLEEQYMRVAQNQTIPIPGNQRLPHVVDHTVETRVVHRPFSIPGSREAVIRFSASQDSQEQQPTMQS